MLAYYKPGKCLRQYRQTFCRRYGKSKALYLKTDSYLTRHDRVWRELPAVPSGLIPFRGALAPAAHETSNQSQDEAAGAGDEDAGQRPIAAGRIQYHRAEEAEGKANRSQQQTPTNDASHEKLFCCGLPDNSAWARPSKSSQAKSLERILDVLG